MPKLLLNLRLHQLIMKKTISTVVCRDKSVFCPIFRGHLVKLTKEQMFRTPDRLGTWKRGYE